MVNTFLYVQHSISTIQYLPSISDLKFDIVRNGTWLTGKYFRPDHIPNIVYQLEEKNVFIIGKAYPFNSILMMVKIRVTGITTFNWLDARYVEKYPEECGKQSTFHEGCFRGESVNQDKYDVDLFARVVKSKGIKWSYF